MLKKSELTKLHEKEINRVGRTFRSEEEEEEAERVQLEFLDIELPRTGMFVTGEILAIDEIGVHVDLPGRHSGLLPHHEVELDYNETKPHSLEVGQEVTAEVLGFNKGVPVLSIRQQLVRDRWVEIIEQREQDNVFTCEILDVNRGGAICNVFGFLGFLPTSHLIGSPNDNMRGKIIKAKFIDIFPEKGKIVVSQRRAILETAVGLNRGEIISGTIVGLKVYGAFLELESGMKGLLHISQISHNRIDNLESLFTVGQQVKAMVLDYDKAAGKLSLSTKALERSPGDMLRDMEAVFAQAEETAKKYSERLENERLARIAKAKEISVGLRGAATEVNTNVDPVVNAAVSIESILASIVGDQTQSESN